MQKVTVMFNEGPASQRTSSGLRIADGLLDANMEVKVLLFEDAVYCAKKGQQPPAGLEAQNSAEKLAKLIKLGVEVLV